MANIKGVQANVDLIKKSYKKHASYGEGATGDDFRMTIEGYDDLEFLVQTTQAPPLGREEIEGFGPHGVKFIQQGRPQNSVDVPVSFKEVIKGTAYKALRDWVLNKKYLTITLGLISESDTSSPAEATWVFEDTWLVLDGADLSVEDAALVKPAGTLKVNWHSGFEEPSETMDWGI